MVERKTVFILLPDFSQIQSCGAHVLHTVKYAVQPAKSERLMHTKRLLSEGGSYCLLLFWTCIFYLIERSERFIRHPTQRTSVTFVWNYSDGSEKNANMFLPFRFSKLKLHCIR